MIKIRLKKKKTNYFLPSYYKIFCLHFRYCSCFVDVSVYVGFKYWWVDSQGEGLFTIVPLSMERGSRKEMSCFVVNVTFFSHWFSQCFYLKRQCFLLLLMQQLTLWWWLDNTIQLVKVINKTETDPNTV